MRYGGAVLLAGDQRPSLALGRDAGCDLVIGDRRASRSHGRIERRGDKFVLSDRSTNGTYVAFAGEAAFLLRREELVLRGRGRVSFAAPADGGNADAVEFEHV